MFSTSRLIRGAPKIDCGTDLPVQSRLRFTGSPCDRSRAKLSPAKRCRLPGLRPHCELALGRTAPHVRTRSAAKEFSVLRFHGFQRIGGKEQQDREAMRRNRR